MFMVGSFASGLSEGLTAGWTLGKDIQDRSYEEKRRADFKKAQDDAKATASAAPSVAAKAPSPTDPDVQITGISTGTTNLTADGTTEPYDPNHNLPPVKLDENGKVPTAKPAALIPPWQSQIDRTKVPDYDSPAAKPAALVPPATGSVVATAAIPPPLPPAEEMATDYPAAQPYAGPRTMRGAVPQSIGSQVSRAGSWLGSWIPTPGPAAGTGGGRARTPAVPGAIPGPFDYFSRPFPTSPGAVRQPAAPPSALGTFGGALIGSAGAPTATTPPPPSSPTPVPIDPRTGQPYQQAVPFTVAPY